MSHWLIRNARLIDSGRRFEADLRIEGERIAAIGANLTARPGEQVFDAAGRTLLPGLIDDQVHFREPGLEHKGSLGTESRAAVAGGITSFMEMPNTNPQTTTLAALEDKYARAARSALANHAFYLGATNSNLEQIKRLAPGQACGVKIFMGASTGDMLVDNPDTLDGIFRDSPTIIATHCEDTPTIQANTAAFKTEGALRIEQHPLIRSREACIKSTRLAQQLARRHDARLHVLHITTADEVALFEPGPVDGKRITAETCVHFLHFDADDYPAHGNLIKCNPAIKSAADREAIVRGVAEGRLSILATDHAPHTLEEKSQPYERAAAGLPLVQHALQCALERCFDAQLEIETVVERFCHAPARLFGVAERGYLREGWFADLVLVDLDGGETVERARELAKVGWSPFEGHRFRSRIVATWVNGHLAWDGERIDDSQLGQRLTITRGRD
jgi:dihydroorotase